MSKLLSASILSLALLFLTVSIGNAQFSSAIQGTVTDPTQAAVPAATVSLKNVATGVSREAGTSAEGLYRISSLGPGRYNLTVQKTGFSSAVREAVEVGISEVVRVDFTLAVGTMAQTLEVQASSPLVETEQGRLSARVERVQLNEMPLNGLQVLNLIAIAPGIVGRGMSTGFGATGAGNDSFSGETFPQMSANGQRYESNNYTLDDTSINSMPRSGSTNLTPNPESVEEVRVVANNVSAVDGRNPGGQMQLLTRGGTNQFHGSAYLDNQNNVFASRSVFQTSIPSMRKNMFGGSLGGPIFKNRAFFFATYSGVRQGGTLPVVYTTETSQFRDYILQTRPNSIAATLLKVYAPAAYPTSGFKTLAGSPNGIADYGNVTFVPAAFRNGDQVSVRLDHELRPGKDRVYGSFFRTTDITMIGGIRPAFNRPTNEWTHFGNLNYTHIFSPNKINEFRVGLMQLIGLPDQYADAPQVTGVPNITVTSVTGFGIGQYPSGWRQTSYDYKDIFSWTRSAHILKIGGELRRSRATAANTPNYIPAYTFANILDFGNDVPLSMTREVSPQTGTPVTRFSRVHQTEWALFLQDDWKVGRNFTLNLGLRYENNGTFKEEGNIQRGLVYASGSGTSYIAELASAKVDYVPQYFPTDNNNFGPRFGFAWDPTGKGKTSVRGGFGVAYDRLTSTPMYTCQGNPPLRATVTLGSQYGTSFTYSLGNPSQPNLGFPVDPSLRVGLDQHNGIIGLRVATVTADPNLRSPYVYNWFLGVQRELWRKVTLEVNYTGSAGHKLFNFVNLNRFAGDMLNGGQFHGLNSSFSTMSVMESTSNSIYHGGTATVKRTFSHGFTVSGSFTYSKTLDDADLAYSLTTPQDAWNRQAERGLAGYDVPLRLSLNGLWNISFFNGRDPKSFVSRVLARWQLSGTAIFDNGMPMNVTTSAPYPTGDFNADGTGGDRPNAPTTPVKGSGWTEQEFLTGIFTVANFPRPVPGTDGNLGHNTYRGPGFAETDLSLGKKFVITERFFALLSLDAFNAFNRVNLQAPTLDLASNTFGRATSVSTPRVFQAGLKFQF